MTSSTVIKHTPLPSGGHIETTLLRLPGAAEWETIVISGDNRLVRRFASRRDAELFHLIVEDRLVGNATGWWADFRYQQALARDIDWQKTHKAYRFSRRVGGAVFIAIIFVAVLYLAGHH